MKETYLVKQEVRPFDPWKMDLAQECQFYWCAYKRTQEYRPSYEMGHFLSWSQLSKCLETALLFYGRWNVWNARTGMCAATLQI